MNNKLNNQSIVDEDEMHTDDMITKQDKQLEELEKKSKHLKVAMVGTYILIAVLFVLFLLFRCQCLMNGSDSDLEKGSIDFVQPKSDRNLQEEVNKAVEQGMFNVFMNTDIILEDSNSKGNLLIQNSETNPSPVFIEIYTKDTNELVYKSDEIPVGYKIEEGKLNVSLDKGTYDCIAYFNVIDETSKEIKNKIGLNVKLTVQN